jgi:hypothetical protein
VTTPKQTHTVTNLAPGSAGDAEVIAAGAIGGDWTPTTQDVNGTTFPYTRGILCGTAGAAKVDMAGGAGAGITIPLQQGYNPIAISKMYASGTAAQNMVALF